jgi:Ras-related protein Rab-1A
MITLQPFSAFFIQLLHQKDDPAVLPVGTEVSAKYKGAFCEAKVRKINRNVKCLVR